MLLVLFLEKVFLKNSKKMDDIFLMKYISVWGWQIMAMVLFVGSIILYALPKSTFSIIFSIALLFGFFVCQAKMMNKQNALKS